MERVAIFVDVGYLCAAGSTAITGSNQLRRDIQLDQPSIIDKLRTTAIEQSDGASLLRIYWYDGVPSGGPTTEQRSFADADDVKLRLGAITHGQQKGVDSLIVTDLVDLARNHAISDAVLVSGDEDVRIGVQIAQSFGVRVHLVGIQPSRSNQSRNLRQESDTTTEWSVSDVGEFMATSTGIATPVISTVHSMSSDVSSDTKDALNDVIDRFMGSSLSRVELQEVANLQTHEPIPNQIDRRLLGMSKNAIGRELKPEERNWMRDHFKTAARTVSDFPSE